MTKDERYLEHIADAADRIAGYTATGREAFEASPMAQDAVLRNIQTLAESTQRLSETLLARHPGVPWKKIAALRNILVHDYLGIDPAIVWEIVEVHLPQIVNVVHQEREK